ncbi:hypothetical protein FF011L_20520 [Roseimaritima multifibrata]|uniref:Uncharacterized protein n=1 Tax=Roseimaritima multifibrata TaxID=1930274 RepID=A0A517MEH3_9BACT|nr:hypothetical protein FF011L_20520 [Roseimaritima multifibrata]
MWLGFLARLSPQRIPKQPSARDPLILFEPHTSGLRRDWVLHGPLQDEQKKLACFQFQQPTENVSHPDHPTNCQADSRPPRSPRTAAPDRSPTPGPAARKGEPRSDDPLESPTESLPEDKKSPLDRPPTKVLNERAGKRPQQASTATEPLPPEKSPAIPPSRLSKIRLGATKHPTGELHTKPPADPRPDCFLQDGRPAAAIAAPALSEWPSWNSLASN